MKKLQRTSLGLAALAIVAALPAGAQTSPITVQAESMKLTSYVVETGRIKLSAANGSASVPFSGATGTYDIQVFVIAESDGQSKLDLFKDATKLGSYTYPLANASATYTLKGVSLTKGQTIRLDGHANGGAWARVDKIVFTPASGGSTSAPADTTNACANPSGGYEGFAKDTTGGYGKAVYHVKNLNDSGSGSLRDALSAGNRCVVFDVGGTISLASNLVVRGANVTIDGLTAPSPGITLKNKTLIMQGASGAHNIVVRGIRSRGTPLGEDAIRVYGASNIVLDRLSVSGFGDGAIDITEKSRNVAIQWSILGDGNKAHNFPSLIKYDAARISVHHNLYVNSDNRNPHCGRSDVAKSLPTEIVCDVRNNLIWNFTGKGTEVRTYGTANVINNYYYTPSSSVAGNSIYVREGGSAYVSGNYSKNGVSVNSMGNRSTPYSATAPTTTDAHTAARQVIANAGARGPRFGLDAKDQAYMKSISID